MSDYASALERTREAFAAVSRLERALEGAPGNRALQMNLRARQRMAARLEDELLEMAGVEHVDFCQYRLIPSVGIRYAVSAVSRSMEKFQELFTLIYDALKNGPKNSARISRGLAVETAMDVGYTYPGSLGIVLSIPGSADLFGGKFDASIDAMHQILGVRSQDEVIDAARALGRATVKKALEWSAANYEADFSVDLTWRKSNGLYRGDLINKDQLARVIHLVSGTSEEENSKLEVSGVLVGMDTPTRWFHFVVPGGDSYKGRLGEDFSVAQEWAINRRYLAVIDAKTVIRYALDEPKNTYELRSLRPEETALP